MKADFLSFGKLFKSKPVGLLIVVACVAIVLILMVLLIVATFSSFRTGIDEAVNTQTSELSSQIVYNYENSINSIIETSNIVQTDVDKFDVMGDEGRMQLAEYLRQIVYLKSGVIRISVYDYATRVCLSSSNDVEIGRRLNINDAEWFYEAVNDPTVHVFSSPYEDRSSDEYRVNVSKRIKYHNGALEGVLKIEISFQSFIDLVDKSNLGDGGHITIIDSNYNVVYTSIAAPKPGGGNPAAPDENEVAGEGLAIARGIILGSGSAVLNDKHMAVYVDTLTNTKWRICVFINVDKLMEIERTFLLTVILVSCIVIVIGVLLFTAVARTITRPMMELEQAMRRVEKSDYFRTEEVSIAASREVEALTRRFNTMMLKIGDLMDRLIDEQNAQRKSELKALQNQINPHFLYNTLDSLLWLIENEKNPEASEMVIALARLFRIGISGDREVIPVRDEIEHVRNYLLIQNIRYAGSFEYEFDIDESAQEMTTMKLVLQPIVENCIYHGLKNKIGKGHIRISASVEDGYLLLRVADNGYGMRQETIDMLYRSFEDGAVSNSVGLKNICQRVTIYYGGNAGMTIESEPDEGTTITVKQPGTK